MKVTAKSTAGAVLASTNIVLPVSDEMDCSVVPLLGIGPAARPVRRLGPRREPPARLPPQHPEAPRRHEPRRTPRTRRPSRPSASTRPVSRRPSPAASRSSARPATAPRRWRAAAEPGSRRSRRRCTRATRASSTRRTASRSTPPRTARRATAATRAPTTKCLRGAMGAAVAADGSMLMQCQSCHGGMSAVGAAGRTGWLQEPSCQQCHTGTATVNDGQIRYTSVFDVHGNPRAPASTVFATNADTPGAGLSLYRFSKGHGGLQCSACHGSTHAEYPSSHANDNLQSIALQGHAGTLVGVLHVPQRVRPLDDERRAARPAPARPELGEPARRRREVEPRVLPGVPRHGRPRDRPLARVHERGASRRSAER